MGALELTGPCGWWAESARAARWAPDSSTSMRDAVAWLGPELEHADHTRAMERARPWLGRRVPGVLPLLDVVPVGRRTAWVYETDTLLSLGAVLTAVPDGLSLRTCAELVARVAEIVEGVGAEANLHPGPEPDQILLAADGSVHVAHFVGPSPRSPARREPHGREDAEALVWRIGVLFAEVLTGAPPLPATDRASHDTTFRRLVIRAMSRPGPPFPDRCRDWLAALLSWEPVERPPLGRVSPGLRELAETLPGERLSNWASTWVRQLRARTVGLESLRPPEPPMDSGAITLPEPRTDHTEEIVLSGVLADRDEVTQVSTDSTPTPVRDRSSVSEHGAIPVGVGPPVEVARKQPTIPRQIFDPTGRLELPTDPSLSRPSSGVPFGLERHVWWTLVMLTVAMVLLAVLVLVWLVVVSQG